MEGSIHNDKTAWLWSLWKGTSKCHVQLKSHTVIKLSLVIVETTINTWKFYGTLSLSVGGNYTYTDD